MTKRSEKKGKYPIRVLNLKGSVTSRTKNVGYKKLEVLVGVN